MAVLNLPHKEYGSLGEVYEMNVSGHWKEGVACDELVEACEAYSSSVSGE
jgi:hypothetical protein